MPTRLLDSGDRLRPTRFHSRFYHLRRLREQVEQVIAQFLPAGAARVLVDFGCGAMPYHSLFAHAVSQYIGADLPRNPLAIHHIRSESDTGLADAMADVVLSTQVLEHVERPADYLRESFRILKPGGILILSTHGYWMFHPDPTDFWRWTSAGLQKVIRDAGFHIERFEGVMGLGASGLQLFQDAVMARLPRPVKPWWALGMQVAIQGADWLTSRAMRQQDACVFVVVARKPQ